MKQENILQTQIKNGDFPNLVCECGGKAIAKVFIIHNGNEEVHYSCEKCNLAYPLEEAKKLKKFEEK